MGGSLLCVVLYNEVPYSYTKCVQGMKKRWKNKMEEKWIGYFLFLSQTFGIEENGRFSSVCVKMFLCI